MTTRVRQPTTRQRDIVRAVLELGAELGHAPSASDVARKLGITRTGARWQLQRLERDGLLGDVPKVVSSGTWEVTEAGRDFVK